MTLSVERKIAWKLQDSAMNFEAQQTLKSQLLGGTEVEQVLQAQAKLLEGKSSTVFHSVQVQGCSGSVSIGGTKSINIGVINPSHTTDAVRIQSGDGSDSSSMDTQRESSISQEILDCTDPIDVDNMYLVAKEIQDWKRLARYLKGASFTSGELNTIKHDHEREGRVEMVFQVLERWKEVSPECATVANLAEALVKVDASSLAAQLKI